MKVKELIQKLEKLDKDLDILCYTEDEDLQTKNSSFKVFEIDELNVIEGERIRLSDETPSIKIEKTQYSKKIVLLEITSDV